MSALSIALTFIATGAVVVAAGTVLARSGDVIAARTRLGGLWVGSIFLAMATSLPELATDIAAVRLGQPDLAAGDLFGSSMANMLILSLLTLLPAGRELFARATLDHALYATLAIVLTCMAAAIILAAPATTIAGVGPGSLALLGLYLAGTRAIFRHTMIAPEAAATAEIQPVPAVGGHGEPTVPASPPDEPPLRPAIIRFVGASLFILAAAPLFARSASELAVITGLGTTFVGTWLVGFATSLPELVTSIAAVRLGAYDLAVGNLFGSNALNMSIFVVLDGVHGGSLLADVAPAHAISALVAIALMAGGLAALVYRARRRYALLEPGSAAMLVTYLAGLALVYAATRS